MKRIVSGCIAAITAVLLVVLILSCKIVQTSQIWKSYKVVYISTQVPLEQTVENIKNNGMNGIICKSDVLTIGGNHITPVMPSFILEGYNSDTIRDFFFTDKNKAYSLFYIPENEIDETFEILKDAGIPFGIDSTAVYPSICPCCCLLILFSIAFCFKIDYRRILCLIPVLSVSYAAPLYSLALSVSLVFFLFAIAELYFQREKAVSILIRNYITIAAAVILLIALILSGGTAILLFVMGIVSSVLLLFSVYQFDLYVKEKSDYRPVKILTAPFISIRKRINLKSVIPMAVVSVILAVSACTALLTTLGTQSDDLYLPSPSEYTGTYSFNAENYDRMVSNRGVERTPDIGDFLNEKWYYDTYPYRKMTDEFMQAEAGETVSMPVFLKTENGLQMQQEVIFSFDDDYISDSVSMFEESCGIEKLLAEQDGMYTTGYTASKNIEVSIPVRILLCIAGLFFCTLTVIFLQKKRHNR